MENNIFWIQKGDKEHERAEQIHQQIALETQVFTNISFQFSN